MSRPNSGGISKEQFGRGPHLSTFFLNLLAIRWLRWFGLMGLNGWLRWLRWEGSFR